MDELLDALIDIIESKRARDKAFEDCDASWGYHGYHIEEELTKAKERFSKALDAMIKRSIASVGKQV